MINISSNYYDGKPEIPLMEGKNVWGTIYFDEKFIPITQEVISGIYDWYLISNYGKVYHKYAGRMLSYSVAYANTTHKPYCSVGLYTENGLISVMVHRLVMACFYPQLGSINQKKDIHNFCKFFQDNYPKPKNLTINDLCREALVKYGFKPDNRYIETLRKIYVKKYYKHISSQYIF